MHTVMNMPISTEEILTAISCCGNNRVPGPDGFPAEFYKAFSKELAPILTIIYNKCNHDIPKSMKDAVICLLFKANSSESPSNNPKWTHRGHQGVTVPEKTIPVVRAEGTTRLRTLTTSSNEFNVPESEIDGVMVDVTLTSNSKVFNDEYDDNNGHFKQSKPKKGILGRSATLKRISQSFKLFNLRTGKMEKFSGFAFSQESGAGRTILTRSEEDLQLKRPEKAVTK